MNPIKKLAVVIVVLLSPVASADQIDLDVSIDLTEVRLYGNGQGIYDAYGILALELFDESVLVSEGDSVSLLITWEAGQILGFENIAFDNLLFPWLHPDFDLSEPGASNFTIDNSEVVIYGADGTATDRIYGGLESNGNSHLGPFLDAPFAEGSSRFISAIQVSYDVLQLQTDSYYYSGVNLQIVRGGTTIITNVPEPGTLALFGIGLAGMSLARRKKKVLITTEQV